MYHRTEIIGNLGDNPRLNYMQDGTAVTNLSVATNRKWTNADGTQKQETIWWQVSAWGRLAENSANYLQKGQQVFVEGRIREPEIWTDQQGNTRASLKLIATQIIFGQREANAQSPQQQSRPQQSRPQQQSRSQQSRSQQSRSQQSPQQSRPQQSRPQQSRSIETINDIGPDEIPY